jgi:hypothetical protein
MFRNTTNSRITEAKTSLGVSPIQKADPVIPKSRKSKGEVEPRLTDRENEMVTLRQALHEKCKKAVVRLILATRQRVAKFGMLMSYQRNLLPHRIKGQFDVMILNDIFPLVCPFFVTRWRVVFF